MNYLLKRILLSGILVVVFLFAIKSYVDDLRVIARNLIIIVLLTIFFIDRIGDWMDKKKKPSRDLGDWGSLLFWIGLLLFVWAISYLFSVEFWLVLFGVCAPLIVTAIVNKPNK